MYERLLTLCSIKNITITELCEKVTGSRGNLSTWKKSYMRSDYLLKCADILEVTTDFILGREKINAPIKTNWSNLTKILNQLTEQEIDSMIDYAEFLLSKRQVPVQPKD